MLHISQLWLHSLRSSGETQNHWFHGEIRLFHRCRVSFTSPTLRSLNRSGLTGCHYSFRSGPLEFKTVQYFIPPPPNNHNTTNLKDKCDHILVKLKFESMKHKITGNSSSESESRKFKNISDIKRAFKFLIMCCLEQKTENRKTLFPWQTKSIFSQEWEACVVKQ